MISAEALRALAAAGATADMIVAAVEADQAIAAAKLTEKRAKDAERKRRSRASASAKSRGQAVTVQDVTRNPDGHADSADMNGSYRKEESNITLQEESKKTKKERAPKKKHPLPLDWIPSESLFAYGLSLGLSAAQVTKAIENLRIWAKANAALKADWDATTQGFFRRDADRLGVQPPMNGAGHGATGRAGFYAKRETPQFEAWDEYLKAGGKRAQTDRAGGWWFTSEFPPDSRALEQRGG